ncbi:hypothetical protein FQZ97_1221500 [compost metagenome]
MQPFELTRNTARSRVKAAAWMGSSWPGMPSVRTMAPGPWTQPVSRAANVAATTQQAIRRLISASRGSILTARAPCLALVQKGTGMAAW